MMVPTVECGIEFRLFHGFRLDNCHNTPIHVAEVLSSTNMCNYSILCVVKLNILWHGLMTANVLLF